MKELSIEKKAKRYDEAIEIAKKINNEQQAQPFNIMTRVFPELKESEDEKIRKGIIRNLEYLMDRAEGFVKDELKERIAWLEKQGDKQKLDGTFVNIDDVREDFVNEVYRVLDADSTNDRANQIIDAFDNLPTVTIEKQGEQKPADIIPQDFEKYVEHLLSLSDGEGHGSPAKVKEVSAELFRLAKLEQKPAWSEEDEKQARQIERIVHNDGCSKKLQEQIANWFKSLKDRVGCEVNCTTTKGWSKDDEEIILKMMFAFTTRVFPSSKECGSFVDFLKSLKHTWKPSEEQIKVCKEVYADILSAKGFDLGTVNSELNRLEEQLKKNKE